MNAVKILNYGISGTGKSHALATLSKVKGLNIRMLAIENNAIAGLRSGFTHYKLSQEEQDRFKIMNILPKKQGSASLFQTANDALTKSPEILAKASDPKKKSYDRYLNVLRGISEFITENDENLGSVDTWGPDTVLAFDGLTIICELIKQNVIGGKLFTSQPEWQRMQILLVQLLRYLTEDLNCHVIMIGHPVRTENPITGVEAIYPSNLGQALKDTIPSMFTDVIYSQRQGKKFTWSTDHANAICAARNLPMGSNLPQDYSQINWGL